jgi:serine-type D-Ala-D-Ala carboxypeptidase/endopeptidase
MPAGGDEEVFDELFRSIREPNFGIAAAFVTAGGATVRLNQGVDALTPNSLFEVGSVTKTITGLLLTVLSDEGVVGLDDTLATYLPRLGANGRVTLDQLATHTSGLADLTPRVREQLRTNPANPFAQVTAEMLLEDVADAELRNVGKVSYSNCGFMLLGHVLAVAVGQPFEDLVRERIFGPLGMATATFDAAGDRNRMTGYRANQPVEHWEQHLGGAGGMEASITDMATYLEALLDPESTRLSGSLRAVLVLRARTEAGLGTSLGWYREGDVVWHTGGDAGFGCYVGLDLEHHRGVAVLTNGDDRTALTAAAEQLLRESAW